MKVALACDHAGFLLKETIIEVIKNEGCDLLDCGTWDNKSVDYPDFTAKACQAVLTGVAARAVIICGSGVGACITANKFKGIYACVCHDTYTAHQGVEHDAMNVLCLGGRVIGPEPAKEIVKAFLKAEVSAEERHQRRIKKTRLIETDQR